MNDDEMPTMQSGDLIGTDTGFELEIEPPGRQIVQAPSGPTPVTLLQQALERNLDPDILQRFMDLQDRYEANEARKAYADAMAKCQQEMPVIVADTPNDQTGSSYAKLGKVVAAIAPVYSRHGFSVSFDEQVVSTEDAPLRDGEIRIRATVMHRLGHCERFAYDLPLDTTGAKGNVNKTAIHGKASSTSYARRYLTLMIFNLSIDDDVDGNLPEGSLLTDDDLLKLDALIDEYGLNKQAILREFGVKAWENLPAKRYDKALERIKFLGQKKAGR